MTTTHPTDQARRRPSRRLRRRGALAVATLSLLAVAACGSSGSTATNTPGAGGDSTPGAGSSGGDTTGVTDTTIKLGTHQPLTGVAAPGYSSIAPGAKAYFDYINDAGGINGRKIDYQVRDDTYSPTKTTEVVNQLVLQDKVFAIVQGLGTPTHTAVLDQLNQDMVPDLFVSSGALAWNQPKKYPYTFGWQPNYEVEGKIIGQYIKKNFPKAKVGLYLQGDDLGGDGAKGVKQFVGDQVVAEVTYQSGNTNVAPLITELKAKGADLVVGFNVPAYTALSQLTATALNYKPKWFYSNVALDPTLVGSLLANFSKGKVSAAQGVGLLDGFYTTKYLATVDQTDDPWVKLWTKVWKAKGDGSPLNNFNVYGMSGAYTIAQSLQAAGKDLNRDSIVKAIEAKGASFSGPALAPFDYSADSHRGISGVKVVQIAGNSSKDLTGIQTTSGGDSPIMDYSGKAGTPPDNGIPPAAG